MSFKYIMMKKIRRFIPFLFIGLFFLMESCGPVVISSRIGNPPPPWFYPNRLEIVRYVYFPEFNIYYDLSTSVYLYYENGSWLRRNTLPSQYLEIDLRRSRYERIPNYREDNIKRYHEEHNGNKTRSTATSRRN